MSTETISGTNTTVLQVTAVINQIGRAGLAIAANPNVAAEYKDQKWMPDLTAMASAGILKKASFEIYDPTTKVLVGSYDFAFPGVVEAEHGPSADAPPRLNTLVPRGAHVRLVVYTEGTPYSEEFLRQLGWGPCDPLIEPDGLVDEVYGTFTGGASGPTWGAVRHVRYVPNASTTTKEATTW